MFQSLTLLKEPSLGLWMPVWLSHCSLGSIPNSGLINTYLLLACCLLTLGPPFFPPRCGELIKIDHFWSHESGFFFQIEIMFIQFASQNCFINNPIALYYNSCFQIVVNFPINIIFFPETEIIHFTFQDGISKQFCVNEDFHGNEQFFPSLENGTKLRLEFGSDGFCIPFSQVFPVDKSIFFY